MSSFALSERLLTRRYQAVASLALLAVLVGTLLVTDLLARSRKLEHSLMELSRDFADKNGTLFSNTGSFIDFEDRLFLDELPNADFSKGGVYFFGSSNMKWAFQTWDLPAEQRRFIGNYGVGATSHGTQLRIISHLIDQHAFLSAKERNLVILGVSFHLGWKDPPSGYFNALLRRHGLYTITQDEQIVPVSMNAVTRWLRIEKARSSGFIWNLGRLAKGWVATMGVLPGRRMPDVALYQNTWRRFMGEQWQKNMHPELELLRETISLLRSHGVQVKLMLLPEATWVENLPFKIYYDAQIRALAQETSTPLIDLSRSMPDEAFVDSSHLTVEAQKKFRDLIMEEITGHLEKIK